MIGFLRKIRRSLVGSDGVRKYTFYALGEIILVVIGILIALSINNWNESKKKRQYELEIISEIYEGLRADSARLVTWWLPRIENKWTGIERMSQYVFERQMPNDSTLLDAYIDMSQGLLISLNFGPFQSLKANGLELISDKKLRFWLVDVFESVLPRQIFALSREETSLHRMEEDLEGHFWKESIIQHPDGSYGIKYIPRSDDILSDELMIQLISEERDEASRKEYRITQIKETIDLTLDRLRDFLEKQGVDIHHSTIGSVLGVRGMLSDSMEVRRFFE